MKTWKYTDATIRSRFEKCESFQIVSTLHNGDIVLRFTLIHPDGHTRITATGTTDMDQLQRIGQA